MNRRTHLLANAGLLSLALLPEQRRAAAAETVPVIDLHVDLSYQVNYKERPIERATGQWVASVLVAAGVAGVVLPLYVPHEVSAQGPRREDLEGSYRRLFGLLASTSPYALPGTVPGERPVQTWLAFEGAAPLAGHTEDLPTWVARGLRVVGLVHSHDNALATSSGTSGAFREVQSGLTPAGRAVVEQTLRLGITVDVSHASDVAVADVLTLARSVGRPVIATHSNARSLARHPRNLSDEQIRAIADTGGVVGINFHGPYLAVGRRASLDDVARHVAHGVKVGGVEHVAIGSDFEGGILAPPGLEGVSGFARLAASLLASGMARADVERIFAGNARRVLGA